MPTRFGRLPVLTPERGRGAVSERLCRRISPLTPFRSSRIGQENEPDPFVCSDLSTLRNRRRAYRDALVVAAKTTLRERWKQVSSEKLNCDVLIATVDDRVTLASIQEMASAGIQLVIPESLKGSDDAHYKGQSNALSFREFLGKRVRNDRPFLLQ